MRMMDVIVIAILAGFTALMVAVVIMVNNDKPTEVHVVHEIKMTEEEMARRPVMQKVEEVEEAEEETLEEPFTSNPFFLYDIVPLDCETQLLTQELCRKYGVSYAFFLAMLESESSFNPDARGDSGNSVGYMQINKPNWGRYGLNAFIPNENLEIGIRMMGELIEKYQEFDMVVMCYKAGESKAQELQAQGVRLNACDELSGNTIWWEYRLNECKGDD